MPGCLVEDIDRYWHAFTCLKYYSKIANIIKNELYIVFRNCAI